MSTDERIDRLSERLDAMAMNLELMQRQYEERFAGIDHALRQVTRMFEVALDSIKRLDNVVVAHEQRLDRIEDANPLAAGGPTTREGCLPENPRDRRLT